MNDTKYLKKIDKIILDFISHFETIALMDLWFEFGEIDDLNVKSVTKDELLSRLEFLAAKGFVKSEGDEWVIKE